MRTLSILSIACAFALTACGGGDDGSAPVTAKPANETAGETAGHTSNPDKPPASVVQNPAGVWIRSEVIADNAYGLISPNGDFLLAHQVTARNPELLAVAGNLKVDQHNALQINGPVHGNMRALLGDHAELSGTLNGDSLSAKFAQPNGGINYTFDLKRYVTSRPQVAQGLAAVKGSYANMIGSRQPVSFSIDDKGVLSGTIGSFSSSDLNGNCTLQGQLTPYDASTPNFYRVRLEVNRPLPDGYNCSTTTSIQTGYAALLEPNVLTSLYSSPSLVLIAYNEHDESTAVTPDKMN
ncbi:hypothetical protein [Burkholderia pseudomallei]|nr:hypothetical protein [Burkholderia pseudomallei]KGW18057.1 putative lipoprotein [Burkholderia pseudomallei MSHR4000]KGW81029.1 putative lipoprotein [Burkholderia pseudomallei MSHR456]MBF3524105.1 hypothetical protein [Burkholderia pseudomallei]CRY45953.1 Uncharacterised protein [Burkholderia pseudomallei]